MRACSICGLSFEPKSHNSSVCSQSCRKTRKAYLKRDWYIKNKNSENCKSRARNAQYSKEQKAKIARNHRIRNNKSILIERSCNYCATIYMPRSHNSKVCSKECRKILIRDLVKSYDYYNTSIKYKLAALHRNRLNKVVKSGGTNSKLDLIGCTIEELVGHLESQFQPGMSWENHGEWHIDHIVPLASFNLENPEELKKACNYKNLQPLWAIDHQEKTKKDMALIRKSDLV